MRRSRVARNAIDELRERAGLADAESGNYPLLQVDPLPIVHEPAYRADATHPLPLLRGRPFYTDGLIQPGQVGAIDFQAQARAQLQEDIPKGAPADPVRVYPAWESRLENMRDFLAPIRLDLVEVVTPFALTLSSYAVPQGYTAFWKTFRFFFDPVPAALRPTNTLITLLVDGDPVPDYYNLPLGPFMTDPQATFPWPIASGRQLSIRLAVTAAVGNVSSTAWCLLYGNLRLSTGLAPTREVGERIVTPPPPVRAVPVIPAPMARPPREFRCQSDPRGQRTVWIKDPTMIAGITGQWRLPTREESQAYAAEIAALACGGPAAKR
jgi:hypothetical protein